MEKVQVTGLVEIPKDLQQKLACSAQHRNPDIAAMDSFEWAKKHIEETIIFV